MKKHTQRTGASMGMSLAAALAALCVAACVTTTGGGQAGGGAPDWNAQGLNAPAKKGNPAWPDFVLNPPDSEDVIYGTGAARMSSPQASLQFADNRARVAIAQAVGTAIKNRMVDLQQGSEGDPAMQQFQQSISESLARANLSGTKVVKREISPDGTVWVLMSLPKEEGKRAAAAALGANPNKRLADTALKEMNAAFDKMDTATVPVEN